MLQGFDWTKATHSIHLRVGQLDPEHAKNATCAREAYTGSTAHVRAKCFFFPLAGLKLTN